MHPVLFDIPVPEFMRGIFPATITIYTYGALIALGAILASAYLAFHCKKQLGIPYYQTNHLILLILVLAIVGGKLLFYLEDPGFYFGDPANMLRQTGKGFVFYGSLIFSISGALLYFRYQKLNTWMMLDLLAITACIVHFFGRLGCFNAGCCYGHVHDGFLSVTFTDPTCMASPLDTPLHPTQLYSAFMILSILGVLIWLKRRKQFNGQVFLVYIMLYAIGRGVVEIYRGDLSRGFIIDSIISHSQFISILLFSGAFLVYLKLRKVEAAVIAKGFKDKE